MILLLVLAIVWAVVLVPPMLKGRVPSSGGRVGFDVGRQLSALASRGDRGGARLADRAETREAIRPVLSVPAPSRKMSAPAGPMSPVPRSAAEAQQRRTIVLGTLGALAALFLLGGVAASPLLLVPGVLFAGVAGGFAWLVSQRGRQNLLAQRVTPIRPPVSFGGSMTSIAMNDEAVLRRKAN